MNPHPLLVAAVALLALPTFASWGAVVDTALQFVVLVLAVVAFRRWTRAPHAGSPHALDAQPLLPGEARWVVGRNGTVLDSCVNERETGIATGWAVGHPIATWAPPGTAEAEHYRAAIEDRRPAVFESRYLDPEKREHVARTALVPRSDGTVYCESWDVTPYVERCRESEARAEAAEERYADLRRFVADDFDEWAAQRAEARRATTTPAG